MNILNTLNWRYATKRMTGEKVPDQKLKIILEAIRLAPTSLGLQPFTIWVIEDEALRRKINERANMQPQIQEASHLLIFAVWDEVSPEKIESYMQNIVRTRGVDRSSLAGFEAMVTNFVKRHNHPELINWMDRQAYIALGVGLVAAAEEQVDATPMEGFDRKAMDEILDLPTQGLHSVVMMTLGYRNTTADKLANTPKVRRPAEELFVHW